MKKLRDPDRIWPFPTGTGKQGIKVIPEGPKNDASHGQAGADASETDTVKKYPAGWRTCPTIGKQ